MIVVRRDIAEAYLRRRATAHHSAAVRRAYETWLAIAVAARWRTPIDVTHSHPKASILRRGRVVFNIKANECRLVAQINYAAGTLEIRFFGSHAEYDRIDVEIV